MLSTPGTVRVSGAVPTLGSKTTKAWAMLPYTVTSRPAMVSRKPRVAMSRSS